MPKLHHVHPSSISQCNACAPNTLLDEAGDVDLGLLGVVGRWADLTVAAWSAEWNYGPGWDKVLLDAHGIQSDPERTRCCRLLYDLSS